MKRQLLHAAIAAMIIPTSAALAGADPVGVPPASQTSFTVSLPDVGAGVSTAFGSEPSVGGVTEFRAGWGRVPRLESVRYRPRRERYRDREYRGRGVSQLHLGFLDPAGPVEPAFVAGFRGGQKFDAVELGLGADWRHKSGNVDEILQQTTGPGGETIVEKRAIRRFSSNLFPVLAYLQVSGPDNGGVMPYAGVAASYETLFLSAEDFQTNEAFDATFAGWGWQLWGGAAMPLSGRSRLVGEVFLNTADLNRDVFDPATGETIRETVSADGVGGRVGVQWGF